MAHSYYAISNNPNVKEGNPLLPDRPSLAQFMLHKAITVPLVADNVESGQMTIMNTIVTLIVINNMRLYIDTPECDINFYYDGRRVPC